MEKMLDMFDSFGDKLSFINLARRLLGEKFVNENFEDVCKYRKISIVSIKILIVITMLVVFTEVQYI